MNRPNFNSFDPHKSVVIYRRHLPHWRQEGATYFVTYRLNDSIPKQALLGWQHERLAWMNAHGIDEETLQGDAWLKAFEKIPLKERKAFERRHYRQFQDCLDQAHGSCCLQYIKNARLALESLRFFHGQRCWTGDAVIMPNHVHALIIPCAGINLEQLLQSIKRYSSGQINNAMGREGRLWQKDTYDHIVRDRKELRAFRNYIAKNASQAGLIAGEGAYHRADWLDECTECDVGPS